MEEELRRILNCMKNSDIIQEGEYYVVHADHIDDLESCLDFYFGKNYITFLSLPTIDDKNFKDLQKSINVLNNEIENKINEIINKINYEEEK